MKVSARGRRYRDGSGDPLDGLVNMFDVGIVLAVGFLLAALSSRGLSSTLAPDARTTQPANTITVGAGDVVQTATPTGPQVTAGQGTPIGQVYRLDDGRLIYVVPSGATAALPTSGPTPSATPTPTG